MVGYNLFLLLLLLAGDVESNPGPPKRGGPSGGKPKEPSKEEQMKALQDKVKDYEEKVESLEQQVQVHKVEIQELRQTISALSGFESEVKEIRTKMESISGVYDDLHEKMHDVDKSIKNNLLFYGITPEFLPELRSALTPRIHDLFRFTLCISRDIPITKVSRLTTGPEIRGSRPVLVSFLQFKDREEILSKSKLLKSCNIYVSEDLSRKTREQRQELQKYMRKVKTKAPNKKCVIRYDKLFIDNQAYVYDDLEGRVVRHHPNVEGPRSDSGLGRDSSLNRRSTNLFRAESVHSVNGHPEGFKSSPNQFGSSDNIHLDSQGSESPVLEYIREEAPRTEDINPAIPDDEDTVENGIKMQDGADIQNGGEKNISGEK